MLSPACLSRPVAPQPPSASSAPGLPGYATVPQGSQAYIGWMRVAAIELDSSFTPPPAAALWKRGWEARLVCFWGKCLCLCPMAWLVGGSQKEVNRPVLRVHHYGFWLPPPLTQPSVLLGTVSQGPPGIPTKTETLARISHPSLHRPMGLGGGWGVGDRSREQFSRLSVSSDQGADSGLTAGDSYL